MRPMVDPLVEWFGRLTAVEKRVLRGHAAALEREEPGELITRLLSAVVLQITLEEVHEALVLAEMAEDLDRDHRAVVEEVAARAKFPGEPGYAEWLAELGIEPSDDTPAD